MTDEESIAFPQFEKLCKFAPYGFYSGDTEYFWHTHELISEFTQLKSLCKEMGEALELGYRQLDTGNMTNDSLVRNVLRKTLEKYQSIFKEKA